MESELESESRNHRRQIFAQHLGRDKSFGGVVGEFEFHQSLLGGCFVLDSERTKIGQSRQ